MEKKKKKLYIVRWNFILLVFLCWSMLLRGSMTKLVILSFKRRIPLKVALEVFKTATVIPSLSLHKLESEFISMKIGNDHCSIFRYSPQDNG
ncbi:unnamed protein product [Larinioides sclopetarius]|uniref:Uncharacterized protein n=1 Tax=Larinioides sclopetarius TaxID=280406 RepID=A0AAV2B7K2_9ARAC